MDTSRRWWIPVVAGLLMALVVVGVARGTAEPVPHRASTRASTQPARIDVRERATETPLPAVTATTPAVVASPQVVVVRPQVVVRPRVVVEQHVVQPRETPGGPAPRATKAPRPAPTPARQVAPTLTPRVTPTPTVPVRSASPVVVAISVDGLNPSALKRLPRAQIPNFSRLMSEGSFTLNARTAVELTRTLPNHTGMITGRSVSGPTGHGVTVNDDAPGTLATMTGRYVPGMFDVAHDHGLRTAFLAEKSKFTFLIRSWDGAHGARDRVPPDNGRDKVDHAAIAPAARTVPQVNALIAAGRVDLVFLHLALPDVVGHRSGWLSPAYLEAVRSVDRCLGSILRTITSDVAIRRRTVLLLTADHGGAGTEHSDAGKVSSYRVPFMAWGAGVRGGTDLYRLNPGRRSPGRGRPGYSGRQPIRNLDIAGTALGILGLPPVAGSTASRWPVVRVRP